MREKRVEDSRRENSYLLMPRDLNASGRLFGGQLMSWVDEMAGVVSRTHAQCNTITAAIDNLQFKSGAFLNDTVVVSGKLTYVGRSSMEIRVDSYVEGMDGMRRVINRAYVVMVAIDEKNKPVEVPRLILEHENERIEWEGAKKREELRRIRRVEGY